MNRRDRKRTGTRTVKRTHKQMAAYHDEERRKSHRLVQRLPRRVIREGRVPSGEKRYHSAYARAKVAERAAPRRQERAGKRKCNFIVQKKKKIKTKRWCRSSVALAKATRDIKRSPVSRIFHSRSKTTTARPPGKHTKGKIREVVFSCVESSHTSSFFFLRLFVFSQPFVDPRGIWLRSRASLLCREWPLGVETVSILKSGAAARSQPNRNSPGVTKDEILHRAYSQSHNITALPTLLKG